MRECVREREREREGGREGERGGGGAEREGGKGGGARVMKPEESHSARDTLCRLEEELINLEEHPLFIIETLRHR